MPRWVYWVAWHLLARMDGDFDQKFYQVPPIKRWGPFFHPLNLCWLCHLLWRIRCSGSDDVSPVLNLTGLEDFYSLMLSCHVNRLGLVCWRVTLHVEQGWAISTKAHIGPLVPSRLCIQLFMHEWAQSRPQEPSPQFWSTEQWAKYVVIATKFWGFWLLSKC